jgi:hypothetical protein
MQIKFPMRVVRLSVTERKTTESALYADLEPAGDYAELIQTVGFNGNERIRLVVPTDAVKLGQVVQLTLTTSDDL